VEPVARRRLIVLGGTAVAVAVAAVLATGLWSTAHLRDRWVDRSGGTTVAVKDDHGCVPGLASVIDFRNRRYVRDPRHSIEARALAEPYLGRTVLPAGVRFTGYSKGAWRLYVDPGDDRAVYVRTPGGVERWPLAEWGCA